MIAGVDRDPGGVSPGCFSGQLGQFAEDGGIVALVGDDRQRLDQPLVPIHVPHNPRPCLLPVPL